MRQDFFDRVNTMVRRRKQPHETYTRYFYEMSALVRACNIIGPDAASYVVDGIANTVVKTGANARRHTTVESLFEYLSAQNKKAIIVTPSHIEKKFHQTYERKRPQENRREFGGNKQKRFDTFKCFS